MLNLKYCNRPSN